jgi:biopolymer transport protein ExbD
MGAVDVPETGGGGKGGKKKKRRINIRLDMTPMVDIAFLLLIFYMVTTVFAAPQAMDINLPKETDEETEIDVKKSNLCVLRVDSVNTMWWSIGDEKGSSRPIDSDNLLDSLVVHNKNNPFLSTLVKIHPKASFHNYVDVLDDFSAVETVLRSDTTFLERYLSENQAALDNFADTTYSYRYTTVPWNDRRDSRMLEFSLDSMRARGERMP